MKAVILAGGYGTRLMEETSVIPKPMVEIGGKPILWHIMKHFSHYGVNEFVIALGYKGDVIKRYFLDYYALNGSMTISLAEGKIGQYERTCEDWTIHLVDTGQDSLTGSRLKRLEPWLRDTPFLVTYGDGVSNVDIGKLIDHHRKNGCLATVTAVRPPARFGELLFDGDLVDRFTEKPQVGEGWINGGFILFEPQVLDEIGDGSDVSLEFSVLPDLAAKRQLVAYRHGDFWQCMDTLRDKYYLEKLWKTGQAAWKVWR